MDSTAVNVVIDSGFPLLDVLLPQIGIFIIIPILAAFKKFGFANILPIATWCCLLCQGTVFGLRYFWMPEIEALSAMQIGFALTGTTLVAHRTYNWGMDKLKNGK